MNKISFFISLMLLCICKCSSIEKMLARFNGVMIQENIEYKNYQPQKNKDCIDDIKDVKIFQTLGEDKGLSFYNGYEVALFKFPSYFAML